LQLIELIEAQSPIKVNCLLIAKSRWCNASFINCRLQANITRFKFNWCWCNRSSD